MAFSSVLKSDEPPTRHAEMPLFLRDSTWPHRKKAQHAVRAKRQKDKQRKIELYHAETLTQGYSWIRIAQRATSEKEKKNSYTAVPLLEMCNTEYALRCSDNNSSWTMSSVGSKIKPDASVSRAVRLACAIT